MSDITPFPEFISHKKLRHFLSKAAKESQSIDRNFEIANESKENLNNHLRVWLESSESLIEHLKKNENGITSNKGSKSILALGAMEAHINMAIQALKAYESQ